MSRKPYRGPSRANDRRPWVVTLSAGVGVLLVAGAAALWLAQEEDEPGSGGPSSPAADLGEVREFDDLDATHVSGDVDYEQSPPVGGSHNQAWMNCGVYDEPVREENVVHSLEHGTFWITYRPGDVDDDGVERLSGVLPQNGILSPYEEQSAPVVITVWGRQLDLRGPEDPRIEPFLDEFAGGATAPEPQASCAGGTPDPQGNPS